MAHDDRIAELMLDWEAARQQGRTLTAEELCAQCPELADEVRRRLHAVLQMEDVLGVTQHDRHHNASTWQPAPESLPVIPGYAIMRVVDRGGMGVVYEARQLELGRTVAIKMIDADRLKPKVVSRFRIEAEAAARLQHPNFVQIFEIGQVGGRPFFSMEYVAGGSLAEALVRERPSPFRAAELTHTLASAIHAAHERGIVHRDLKPGNVMLAADGTPKIADFGLAKRLDDDADHTHTGEILGTPSYMAPEQAEGKKDQISPATDVYALGAILYEMLAGKPPFQGTSPLDSLRRVVTHDPVPPSLLARAVPRDLEAICLKCLEKAPSRRYESAQVLADDLARFLDGRPVSARRIGPVRRAGKWMRRHPQGIALCAALAMLLLIPLVLLLAEHQAQRETRQRAQDQAPLVREILQRHCFACHGQDPKNVRKNLNLLQHPQLLDSVRRIVVPGAPEDSRMIQRIADGSMPPEEEETHLPRVSEEELVILKNWIRGGAPLFPAEAEAADPAAAPRSELAAKTMAIFQEHCYECHKYDVAKGGIKILHHRLLVNVRKVVIPGRPDDSELFHLITTADEDVRMPRDNERLSPAEIAVIRAWILEGAPPFPKKN